MIELLSLPGHKAPPTSLDDWVAQLSALGGPVTVTRDAPGASWLELANLRLRGYAVREGGHVGAINFELTDPDPTPASRVVESAARVLGWEVHPDDPDDDDPDFQDDDEP
jgi:hypothetical protein